MLKALGLNPTAYHMNEGHSAFMALERIRAFMDEAGLSFAEALQVARASQMFTTHTPVPAGIDLFPPEKVLHYLGHYQQRFSLGDEEFLALGRTDTGDFSAPFSMAVLAIKTATFINGVSKLHAEVSREMFSGLWTGLPLGEVPVYAITNGVHARSCVAKSTQALYDRYLGPNWSQANPGASLWERVHTIPDDELWRNHEQCRSHLVVTVRERLAKSLIERGGSARELTEARECLDPFVLTVGFARRFATYKRATLFLHDLERIRKLINGTGQGRRVQFVIAGKAHPKDIPGKELIRSIIHFTRDEGLSRSIVFVPNYDIHLSRDMVAGCDVWLNNPRRPREASGTSGMKAAMNGLPNLSVLDGWWDEADYIRTGWPIGHGEDYDDPDYQDDVEANALYDILEKEIVPLFYERDKDEIPRGWVAKMKQAIYFNTPQFNTARMVKDYANHGYFAASDRAQTLISQNYGPGRELAVWQLRLTEHWYDIRFEEIAISAAADLRVNQPFKVVACIQLGAITPDDVQVELYQGTVGVDGEIHAGFAIPMTYQGQDANGRSFYIIEVEYSASGLQGLSLRILPKHRYLNSPYDPKLILWANPEQVAIVSTSTGLEKPEVVLI
jgi:starch phosphorylase